MNYRHPAENPSERQPLAVATDHAGFDAKERLLVFLRKRGVPHVDLGVHSPERTDYPVLARAVAQGVLDGSYARGLLVCGTGLGMSIAANRFKGIRAALCWSVEVARLSRGHNDANILVLPGRVSVPDALEDILAIWLATPYSAETRHGQRLAMLDTPTS